MKASTSLLALFLVALQVPLACAGEISELLSRSRTGGKYTAPSRSEVERAEELFALTLANPENLELPSLWKQLGVAVKRVEENGSWLALVEEEGARRGRGLYLLRLGGGAPVAIQAPHSRSDKGTGDLAEKLLLEGGLAAGAWNTRPRAEGDLSAVDRSYLAAFSRAFVRHLPEGRIVQLHGFSPDKRASQAARRAGGILSDGTRHPSPSLRQVASCLEPPLAGGVILYGAGGTELGGTRNRIGRLLREDGFDGFIHLELSPRARNRLLQEGDRRSDLLGCLSGSGE